MSQENIEIVKAVHPPSGTDLKRLFADDADAPARLEASRYHPDFEFSYPSFESPETRLTGNGLTELAEIWREWMEPWGFYWTDIEAFLDAGEDRVAVLLRDHGRMRGSDAEVETIGASIWTVRDGRIARIEFYLHREAALEAAGLRE